MLRIIGILKLSGAFLFILCLLVQFGFSFANSNEIWVNIFATFLITLFSFPYCYYLIKTGFRNLKNEPFSVNILLGIGLLIHFVCCIFLIIYSQHLFPSKEASNNLLFTTLPFFAAAMYVGVQDSIIFYKSWKASRISNK
jgi:hypothetical protein